MIPFVTLLNWSALYVYVFQSLFPSVLFFSHHLKHLQIADICLVLSWQTCLLGSVATYMNIWNWYSYFIPGAIPVMNEVMSATRGATDAFSGITRHLNNSVSFIHVFFLYTLCILCSLFAIWNFGPLKFSQFSHVSSGNWELRTSKLALGVELVLAMVLVLVCATISSEFHWDFVHALGYLY